MAGSAIEIRSEELERLNARMNRFFRNVTHPTQGMRLIANMLESQTRRRIESEKKSPDGEQWQGWSEKYAKTRHGRNSLLRNRDNLYKSITADFGSDFAQTYTEMVYGRRHQEGDDEINLPARPFMGLSRDNQKEVEEVFADWVEGRL